MPVMINKQFSKFSASCTQNFPDTDESNIFNYLTSLIVSFNIQ